MINIVLFRPEKPQNTGNIMRTCVAIHACLHIIGPLSFSIDSKDLKRVGMDYIDDLKMFYYSDYQEFLNQHPDENVYYVTRYADTVYSSFDFSDPIKDIYVMFGRESTGIDKAILSEHKDFTLRIPMLSTARSLNLSNSVAIVVYDILRQQKFPSLASFDMIHKYRI